MYENLTTEELQAWATRLQGQLNAGTDISGRPLSPNEVRETTRLLHLANTLIAQRG